MVEIIAIGVGATAAIDVWALVLRRGFGIRSLDYCLLGRWALHMPTGAFRHDSIAAADRKPYECEVGWLSHYSIGVVFSMVFVWVLSPGWLDHPTFWPALAFGLATVLVPFLTLQPAFGLGVASSRTRNPTAARLKSLSTHAVFGVGLYLSALVIGALAR